MIRKFVGAGALMLAMTTVPAAAQDATPDENNFTLGVAALYVPSYEGSDNYIVTPGGLIRGRVSGFNFYTRGTALHVDLARNSPDTPTDLEIGPVINLRLDRTSRIKDPQVRALGEIDTAVEAGGYVGLTRNGVFHQYDFASARVSVVHDLTDTHDSLIVSPSVEYATPLSQTTLVGASLSADHVGGGYARTYFGVSPAGAVASGLSPYTLDGGFKNVRGTLLFTQSLSGDLRRGLALFALGSYSRLLGNFKRSPIVSEAGDADQWLASAGISYTF